MLQDHRRLVIDNLPDLIIYVQSLNGTISTPVGYNSKILKKKHNENVCLYIDKYFETSIPDIQTEFLLESSGISPDQYEAWLDPKGKFWVNQCNNEGVISSLITPNVKGSRFNPYRRFVSSKHSGASQVEKMLDLVGANFKNIDNVNPTVFDLLVLTFPFDIAKLLIDPRKRDKTITKLWKCWKLFFKHLHLWFGIDSDHLLGANVSLHLWSSEFPFIPHPHFHVVFPHWSYLNVNDSLSRKGHIKNNSRVSIERCSISGGDPDLDFCKTCILSEDCLSHKYDLLYGLIEETVIVSKHEENNSTYRFIPTDKQDLKKKFQIDISKCLCKHLDFNVLSWDGKTISYSKNDIPYEYSLPIDVNVFRNIWFDCVNEVFGIIPDVENDNSVYDIHVQWVDPDQRAKLLHHMQYKSRPPVLDLDLFFRKCPNLITDYNELNPSVAIDYIRSLFVNAVLKEDISGASRYELVLQKIECLFNMFSDKDFFEWLQFLSLWKTDTRVFGFWRMINRYRVTSVIRGELPKFHICPVCGGELTKITAVDVIFIDCFIKHIGSKFLLVDIKDPPDECYNSGGVF